MYKLSPIAKYLTENQAYAIKDKSTKGLARLYKKSGEYIGFIRKKHEADTTSINIQLYRQYHDHPFIKKITTIQRTLKYFLSEKKFMPVKIDIEHTLTDYDKRQISKDKLGRGLVQDRYIEEIKEDDEILKSEREKYDIPNIPIFRINKLPFRYDFKYHLYEPNKKLSEIAFNEGKEVIK